MSRSNVAITEVSVASSVNSQPRCNLHSSDAIRTIFGSTKTWSLLVMLYEFVNDLLWFGLEIKQRKCHLVLFSDPNDKLRMTFKQFHIWTVATKGF